MQTSPWRPVLSHSCFRRIALAVACVFAFSAPVLAQDRAAPAPSRFAAAPIEPGEDFSATYAELIETMDTLKAENAALKRKVAALQVNTVKLHAELEGLKAHTSYPSADAAQRRRFFAVLAAASAALTLLIFGTAILAARTTPKGESADG